jgi:hypothetical protein
MKDFANKLIDRLEEERESKTDFGYLYIKISKVISIVRELAGEYKQKTNADRIRNMSDDELTDFIYSICCFENDEGEDMKLIDEKYEIPDHCKNILEWLQSEAE